MKKPPMPAVWFLGILLLLLLFSIPVEAGPRYVGIWQPAAKYVDGALQNNIPATLVLTETSYSSIVPAPPEEVCAFSGSMLVHNGVMKVTVKVSACPEAVPVGLMRKYHYTVTDGGRTPATAFGIDPGPVKKRGLWC